MIANPVTSTPFPESTPITTKTMSWETFLLHPPERMEWVDSQLIEKTSMTFKQGATQAALASFSKGIIELK